ncbi:hypothetical protein HDV00_011329 [Rhizophlyctis rosea]|nr:hypothetical protein HDV00_011329 [Rhizophlyctis rosea]
MTVTGAIQALPAEIVAEVARFLPLADIIAFRCVNRFTAKSIDIKLCLQQHVPLFEELRRVGGDEFALSVIKVRKWGISADYMEVYDQLAWSRPYNLRHWIDIAIATRNSEMLAFILADLKAPRGCHYCRTIILRGLRECMLAAVGQGWLQGVMSIETSMQQAVFRHTGSDSEPPSCGTVPELILVQHLEEIIISAANRKHFAIVDHMYKSIVSVLPRGNSFRWFTESLRKLRDRVDRPTLLKCTEIGRGRGLLHEAYLDLRQNRQSELINVVFSEDDPSCIPVLTPIRDEITWHANDYQNLLYTLAERAVRKGYRKLPKEVIGRLELTTGSVRRGSECILCHAIDVFETCLASQTDEIQAYQQIIRICIRSPLFSEHIPDKINDCISNLCDPITLLLLENGWRGDLDCCRQFVEGIARRLYFKDKASKVVGGNGEAVLDGPGERSDEGSNDVGSDVLVVGADTASVDRESKTEENRKDVSAEEFSGILKLLVRYGLDITDESLVKRMVMNCLDGNGRKLQVVINALVEVRAVVGDRIINEAMRELEASKMTSNKAMSSLSVAEHANGNAPSSNSIKLTSLHIPSIISSPLSFPASEPLALRAIHGIPGSILFFEGTIKVRCGFCKKLFKALHCLMKYIRNKHSETVQDTAPTFGMGGAMGTAMGGIDVALGDPRWYLVPSNNDL